MLSHYLFSGAICFIAGFIIGTYVNNKKTNAINTAPTTSQDIGEPELEGNFDVFPNMIFHNPPTHYSYEGGYTTVTICTLCGIISLYEDQSPNRPCKACGANVVDSVRYRKHSHEFGELVTLSAKWQDGLWHFATTSARPEDASVAYKIYMNAESRQPNSDSNGNSQQSRVITEMP